MPAVVREYMGDENLLLGKCDHTWGIFKSMSDTWADTADKMQAQLDALVPVLNQAGYNLLAFQSNMMPKPTILHNELLFAVNLAARDISTQLVLLVRQPWARLTVEKMLTLTAREAENAIEILLGQQRGEVGRQASNREYIDPALFAEAQEQWRRDKDARAVDAQFEEAVNLIRSTTAAHLYSTHGQRLNTHVAWVSSRADKLGSPDEVMNSQIVTWASNVLKAVRALDTNLSKMRDAEAWADAVKEQLATRTGEFSHELDPRLKS